MMTTASHRTPDRIPFDRATTSAERKLQQRIKTPTRTPTRTPPTTRTPTPTPTAAATTAGVPSITAPTAVPPPSASPAGGALASSSLPPRLTSSLICKIDLSRLLHIPAEWHANTYRLYGGQATSGHHLTPASAGRTPIYDHETILNADLQSCNTQMRLKSSASGGSGSGTPRSTGNRTPLQTASTISIASERELSHSRESLHEIAKDNGNPGRLSSRSTDGSIGGGGSTPKDLSSHLLPPGPPNGYSSVAAMARGYPSPSSLMNAVAAGGGKLGPVKHEQIIKHEPADSMDYSATETKFKADASSADPTLIKQENLILKQDYKPSDLVNMAAATEKNTAICSPNDTMLDAKPRRKRSSSSSSSPYKEKKRKKEKERDKDRDKDKEKEKDNKDRDKEKEMSATTMLAMDKDKLMIGNGGAVVVGSGVDIASDVDKNKDILADSLKPAKDSLDAEMINTNGKTQVSLLIY